MEIKMKAQRLKITERGWENYSDTMLGIQFKDGLSVDAVSHVTAAQLGSVLRVEAVDDGAQVGAGVVSLDLQDAKAVVVVPLTEKTPDTTSPEKAAKVVVEKYTRTQLEEIADQNGIAGLRSIAEKLGVKGRGIVELINEILKAQA
jgi:hypothetical protein